MPIHVYIYRYVYTHSHVRHTSIDRCAREEQLLLVAQLFLCWPGGPQRLPRPSELLFGGPDVLLAEVKVRVQNQFWQLNPRNHFGRHQQPPQIGSGSLSAVF